MHEQIERQGTAPVDDQFDGSRKEHIKKEMKVYSEMSNIMFWKGGLVTVCRDEEVF